ncbi:hypothetical protein EDD52_108126 [Primorskyibacter sedentarius]|uniref:Uncharacterized protein n=1 Tax=Primorskyibacter sedentarius TaxID=745311 RepID=A0A4V2UNP4_9RHOB|nr:hypothetical protein EDD52_108126 [Primorskyibacter sedentarius]
MRPDSRRVHYYNVRSETTCNQRLISAWVMDLTCLLPGLAGVSFDVEGAGRRHAEVSQITQRLGCNRSG